MRIFSAFSVVSPSVGQRLRENGLLTGYGGVRSEIADAVDHVNGSWVVPLKLVEAIENRLQFIAMPDVVVVIRGRPRGEKCSFRSS